MKPLWTILSVLAVANLLAILGFVGWLKISDRIDMDRLEQVRTILSETRAEQEEREADEEREALLQAAAEEQEERDALPPLSGADQVAMRREEEQITQTRVERLRREIDDLRRTLKRERDDLDEAMAEFEAEREKFEAMRRRIQELEGDEQFRRTLALYESLPANRAQPLLQALINDGEINQVVAYLNGMQTRTASKIIERFEDPALAAELLERLRTRGLEARGPESR
ncbi:MAG: hypothetical protein EA376_10325 [Phycisphaeraceae bacterium]|nr:MAG: hypothetical protein EA376_10325 [Phycisphaeraceae bacterium]